MTDFTIHTPDTAPADAKPLLEGSQKAFGFVPNLHGIMAEAPAVLEGYQQLTNLVQKTSFTKTERHVAWLVINFENQCHYCMAAHTGLAQMDKVDQAVIEALRAGDALPDPKLEALRTFLRILVVRRGWADDADIRAFMDAGFTKQQVLEAILVVSHKVLSNYVNHLANTPVDGVFAKNEWHAPAKAAE